MHKYVTLSLLILAAIWQVTRIRVLHNEINCISRIECNYCEPQNGHSFFTNYFSKLDSLESPDEYYSEEDKRNRLDLERNNYIKSNLVFRPFISDVVIDDSCTSFNLNIGQFKKITDGHLYHLGIKSSYHSDQCLPEKFDSIVSYWVDEVTGMRFKIIYP